MFIQSLRLYQFRSLHDQSIQFSPYANFLHGQNGQGKTNVVEAMALLATGRSFRTTHLNELVRWGKDSASVFAKILGNQNEFEIGVSIQDEKKSAYLNGDKVEFLSAFLGKVLAVTFSPTDLILVRGAPQERRRFLDKHLVDFRPNLMSAMLEFHRALKNKNAILRSGRADIRQLEVWDGIIAQRSLEIYGARQEFLLQLQERAEQFAEILGASDGGIGLRLKSNIGIESHESLCVERIIEKITAAREREIGQGISVIGSHRDDVIIELGGKAAKAFASQGQARTIILALKLAVIELVEEQRGEAPILLLDDVESELDSFRREKLIELIFAKPRQVFMTGTAAPLELLQRQRGYQCLEINAGKVGALLTS